MQQSAVYVTDKKPITTIGFHALAATISFVIVEFKDYSRLFTVA